MSPSHVPSPGMSGGRWGDLVKRALGSTSLLALGLWDKFLHHWFLCFFTCEGESSHTFKSQRTSFSNEFEAEIECMKGKRGAILMEMVQQPEASSCCSPVAFGHFHGSVGLLLVALVENLILVYHKGAIYPLFCLHK